jgi:HEAT repeat protein
MFDTAAGRCVLFLASGWCLVASAQTTNLPPLLDASEQAAVVEALRCLKMTPADLSYKKDYAEAPYRLEKVQRFLGQPFEMAKYSAEVTRQLEDAKAFIPLTRFAIHEMEAQPVSVPMDFMTRGLVDRQAIQTLAPALQNVMQLFDGWISFAHEYLQDAFHHHPSAISQRAIARYAVENLRLESDPTELEALGRLDFDAPLMREMIARDDALVAEDDEYARDLLPAWGGVDRGKLLASAAILAWAMDNTVEILTNHWGEITNSVPREAKIRIDTRLGPIFIGGSGTTHYTEDALLIIDLGGEDIYDCHAGGANGLADRPISIVIDLSGRDHYRSGTLSLGAGVFGIGILVDCDGNDIYEGKHLCQGAGLFGVGILADYGGNDSYTGDINAQGAGIFGVGILWDRGGDDRLFARQSSQGFGYTGGLGLLLDGNGNDTYYAGGKYADHERLPEHYLSCSQGFGYGMRPDAGGGVGILCDLAGNDVYTTDIYGQGVGYFYSLGMLLDAQGNDVYRCHQYGQGAGIHLAAGILADWQGDDQYVGHAILQGSAHDWSVGMLFDKQGNDQYVADSTAQGSALYNSTALLADSAGNDLYASPKGSNTQAAGHDGERREYGTIALLLDLAGKDNYSNGPRDDFIALKPLHGCVLDTEKEQMDERATGQVGDPKPQSPSSSLILHPLSFASSPTELSRPRDDQERRWQKLIRQAIQYPDTAKKAREKAIAYELLLRDGAAVLPFWLRQLDHDALMVRVRLDEFMDVMGATNAAPALLEALQSPNELVRRQACYYVGKLKVDGATEFLRQQLAHDKVRAIALWSLGELKAPAVMEEAARYRDDPQESVRMRANAALGKLGDPRGIPQLIAALDDPLWNVRYVAQAALIKIGKPSLPPMLAALPNSADRARSYLIEAIGRVGDAKAANALRPNLRSNDWLVRGTAVAAIANLKPRWWEAERRRMLHTENQPFVLSRLHL